MAEANEKVHKAQPITGSKSDGCKVRLRNCDYPLTGSINMEGSKPIKFSLPPNTWVWQPQPVIDLLRRKFAEPTYVDVPAALPDGEGENYLLPPGHTRREQAVQYVIEFSQ